MPSSLALYKKLQREANKVLRIMGMPAVLRGPAGDTPCLVIITEFTAMERMGRVLDPLDLKATISGKNFTMPEDVSQYRLVTFIPGSSPPVIDQQYRIVMRPAPLAPAGLVVTYDLTVRKY